MHTATVAKTCEFGYILCIAHESLVYRIHRVFKCKRTFELSRFYAEVIIFLPFGKQIHHSRTASEIARIAVELQLGFPIKIPGYTPVKSQTQHTDIERIRFVALLETRLILCQRISAELYISQPGR